MEGDEGRLPSVNQTVQLYSSDSSDLDNTFYYNNQTIKQMKEWKLLTLASKINLPGDRLNQDRLGEQAVPRTAPRELHKRAATPETCLNPAHRGLHIRAAT
jgi:hypothetical protein